MTRWIVACRGLALALPLACGSSSDGGTDDTSADASAGDDASADGDGGDSPDGSAGDDGDDAGDSDGAADTDAGEADTGGDGGTDSGETGAGDDTGDTGEDCTYPAGALEPMTLGEVLYPYSWPTAIHGDDRITSLKLAKVPCATDEVIDWSPHDVLVFVSIPVW